MLCKQRESTLSFTYNAHNWNSVYIPPCRKTNKMGPEKLEVKFKVNQLLFDF